VRLCFAFFLSLLACLVSSQARVLKPGDQLQIVSVEDASLCVTRLLGAAGDIQLPGFGSVHLAGLSLEEANRLITKQRHLAPGDLTLNLVPLKGKAVLIYGAVRNVGELSLTPNMRLADALRIAGPTVAADLDLIEIESDAGQLATVSFDASPLRPEANPYLQPGDRIVLPLASGPLEVAVVGGVKKTGPVAYQRGITVQQAIDAAGGPTNHANTKDVRILRGGVEVRRLDLAQSGATELHRADTVVVALADSRRFVTVVGEVKNGGLIAWKEGMTLKDAIHDAGGGTDKADLENLRVQRMLGEDRFRKLMGLTKSGEMKLIANDVIQVPLKGATPPPPKPNETGPKRVVPPL